MFLESWNKIILDLDTRKSEHRDRNKDHRYYNRVIALSVREMAAVIRFLDNCEFSVAMGTSNNAEIQWQFKYERIQIRGWR